MRVSSAFLDTIFGEWWWSRGGDLELQHEQGLNTWRKMKQETLGFEACWLVVGWVNGGLLSGDFKWMVALITDDGCGSCQVMLTNHVPSYIEVQYKHSALVSDAAAMSLNGEHRKALWMRQRKGSVAKGTPWFVDDFLWKCEDVPSNRVSGGFTSSYFHSLPPQWLPSQFPIGLLEDDLRPGGPRPGQPMCVSTGQQRSLRMSWFRVNICSIHWMHLGEEFGGSQCLGTWAIWLGLHHLVLISPVSGGFCGATCVIFFSGERWVVKCSDPETPQKFSHTQVEPSQ